jgi:ParB/RepB/Spo0J family partition protein
MLQTIPISHITEITNYRDSEPVALANPDIQELASSISKDGLLQPVLVRPHAGKKDRFQLIFGHRRLVACKLAGLTEIPANVKEVADDDILEIADHRKPAAQGRAPHG